MRSIKRKKIRVVDLFSGCGGMSLGFQNAGFDIVAAFENWAPAIQVYGKNFKHPVHTSDLSKKDSIQEICALVPEIIIGGPPCQDFSSAGHRDESLGRANLTSNFAQIIIKSKPNYFVMENVPTIQKSQILATIKKQFKKTGYGLTSVVLDASLCGVPQQRKRFFLIGDLSGEDNFLNERLLAKLSNKKMTMFDYFGDSLGFKYYFRVPRSYSRRGVYSIHEPSMTIRGVDRPVPKGYPGHPADPINMNSKIRTLTPAERSQVQTFPEDFEFVGTKTNINQMIGNAVPVKLAEFVAKALHEYIEQKNKN